MTDVASARGARRGGRDAPSSLNEQSRGVRGAPAPQAGQAPSQSSAGSKVMRRAPRNVSVRLPAPKVSAQPVRTGTRSTSSSAGPALCALRCPRCPAATMASSKSAPTAASSSDAFHIN